MCTLCSGRQHCPYNRMVRRDWFQMCSENYRMTFKRDSTRCILSQLRKKAAKDSVVTKEMVIEKSKERIIIEYITKLSNHEPSSDLTSNASNYYRIKFKNQYK